MRIYPSIAALFGGTVLAVVLSHITGYLAAIGWPAWFAAFARRHVSLALFISDLTLFSLPVGLISFAFGFALFRVLRTARAAILVSCIAGWLVSVVFLQVLAFSASTKEAFGQLSALLSHPSYWLAMLPVPLALASAAWLLRRANPSVERTHNGRPQ
jgi:hypothetical protein